MVSNTHTYGVFLLLFFSPGVFLGKKAAGGQGEDDDLPEGSLALNRPGPGALIAAGAQRPGFGAGARRAPSAARTPSGAVRPL